MFNQLIKRIENEKGITPVVNDNHNNLFIFEKKYTPFDYIDIICFVDLADECHNWELKESQFLKVMSDYKKSNEGIEPYLIFFMNEESYKRRLKEVVEIEKDEFYCRKFVYPINEITLDDEHFIRKLPFGNPLIHLEKRAIFQPAREMLIRYGIEKSFADILVSNSPISTEKKKDLVKFFRTFDVNEYEVEDLDEKVYESESSIRLTKMEVEGFRAYGEKVDFDLDADLIVLYGSNGFGKTTFFDAFEYLVTGEIKRFSNREDKTDLKIMKHLGYEGSSSIELEVDQLSNSGKVTQFKYKREIEESSKLKKNGETIYTKTVLRDITDKKSEIKGSVKDIIRLFRATHINNQDDAELTENVVKGSSTIPNDILGKMISFEDYTIAQDKLKLIKQYIGEYVAKEITIDLEKKCDERDKLKSLILESDSVLKEGSESEVLKRFYLEVDNQIEWLWQNVSQEHIKTTNYNEIISVIEFELGKIISELIEIQKLEKLMAKLDTQKEKTLSLMYEDSLKRVENLELDIVHNLRKREINKIETNKVQKKFLDKSDLLKEYNEINFLCEQEQRLIKERKDNEKILEELNLSNQKIEIELDNLNNELALENEMMYERNGIESALKSDIDQLEKVCLDYEAYEAQINEKDELEKEINILRELINKEESDVHILENEFKIIGDQNKFVSEKFAKAIAEFDTYQRLLNEVKVFIDSEKCPVCSHEHESRDNLLYKIDKKLIEDSDEVKELRSSLSTLKEQLVSVSESLVLNRNRFNESKTYYERLLKNKSDLEKSISEFNILLKPYKELLKLEKLTLEDLKILLERQKEELKWIEKSSNLEQIKVKQRTYEKTKGLLKMQKEKVVEIEKNLLSLMNHLHDNASLIKGLFNYELLINSKEQWSENYRKEIESDIDSIRVEEKTLLNIDHSLNETKITKENELSMAKKKADELENSIKQLKIDKMILETNKDKIENKEFLNIKQEDFENLKEKILRILKLQEFESMDIENKKNKAQLDSTLKAIEILTSKKEEYNQAVLSIDKINEILIKHNNSIIKNYCDVVEPLISIIQNRLRVIYGFSDCTLTLDSKNQEVMLSNSYQHGKNDIPITSLKPHKYLSEAQKNIIRISVFLATTLSQNWSNFKTIFLDDPIQHFDDLNVYAFLELLKSIIFADEEKHRRQVIISTCDRRFFNLLREKFSVLFDQGRAKYYVFKSLDINGPEVEKLESDLYK